MTTDPCFSWVEIDLGAIQANFLLACHLVGTAEKVTPVIKTNGYGLGALAIAHALRECGATRFCIARVEEARLLRQAGIDNALVMMSGLAFGQEQAVVDLKLTPFVWRLEEILALAQCVEKNQSIGIVLKINTGMGRLGFSPEAILEIMTTIDRMTGVHVVGVASHLACADEWERPETGQQVALLRKVLAQPVWHNRELRVSMANSAGILAHPQSHFDWVRPGLMLYGVSPFGATCSAPLVAQKIQPVVTWRTRIVQIRPLSKGDSLGYNHTFTAQRASRIALLPVGYGDGYFRSLSNKGQVLVHDQRARVVGNVCMDLIAIDITDLVGVKEGDVVTLLGKDETQEISIHEYATWAGTISYEVLCRFGSRVVRCYVNTHGGVHGEVNGINRLAF
ncbi:MAG: alanine racemase [Magnetococcus sp. DMHC-6]